MGFLDKARKMAEQAQAKLDEAQEQFNQRQQAGSGGDSGPPVEYDDHGRPIRPGAAPAPAPAEGATPPHGDPVAPHAPEPPASAAPVPDPSAPQPPSPGAAAPAAPAAPPGPAGGPEEDRNRPSYEPPKLSSGDPLAGA